MDILAVERFVKNAEAAFDKNEYLEGLAILEEALAIDPNSSKVHNHMGWVYLYHVNDLQRAEKHLSYALGCENVFGPAYIHKSYLLFNKGKYAELEALLQKAFDHGGVERAFVFVELGKVHEVCGRFRKAIKCYKKAVNHTFDDKELMTLKEGIHRCRQKRWIRFT